MPVSAEMLTWCVTTTSAPGPVQFMQHGPRRGLGLRIGAGAVLKEGIERRLQRRPVPGKARSAVSRVRHHCDAHTAAGVDAMAAKRGADASRLRASGLIQVALGGAVAKSKSGRIADSGRVGMAQQHDGAVTQCGPGELRHPDPRPLAGIDSSERSNEKKPADAFGGLPARVAIWLPTGLLDRQRPRQPASWPRPR